MELREINVGTHPLMCWVFSKISIVTAIQGLESMGVWFMVVEKSVRLRCLIKLPFAFNKFFAQRTRIFLSIHTIIRS